MPQGYNLNLAISDYQQVDWKSGSEVFKSPKGKLVVEMLQTAQQYKHIVVPDSYQKKTQCHIGVVLSAGCEVDSKPGEYVITQPGYGTVRKNVEIGEYKSKGLVKWFGMYINEREYVYTKKDQKVQNCPWYHCIVASIKEENIMTLSKDDIILKNTCILIKRDPVPTQSEGGVLLTGKEQNRTHFATIVRCGPRVQEEESKPGSRIIYHPFSQLNCGDLIDDEDYSIIQEESIESFVFEDYPDYNPI